MQSKLNAYKYRHIEKLSLSQDMSCTRRPGFNYKKVIQDKISEVFLSYYNQYK